MPPYIVDSIDAVRNIGNFAAHANKNTSTGEILPVKSEEAEWNLDVLEALFDFYYVQSAKLQKKRDALDKKLHDTKERIPFDISGLRSIPLDIHDLDSVKSCKQELQNQIVAILEKPDEVTSPYTAAIDIQTLRSSDNPIAKALVDIKESIEILRGELAESNELMRFKDRKGLIKSITFEDASIVAAKDWYQEAVSLQRLAEDLSKGDNEEQEDNEQNNNL